MMCGSIFISMRKILTFIASLMIGSFTPSLSGQTTNIPIFYDGFNTGAATPWTFYQGTHLFTGGILKLNVTSTNAGQYAYIRTNWSNISVQADVRMYPKSWGAGIGLRYNPTNGANYSAWLYQSNSPSNPGKFSIKKYNSWYNNWFEVATAIIPDPGTNFHNIKLLATNNIIVANLDNTRLLAFTDPSPLLTGGINLSIWGGSSGAMSTEFDNVMVYNLDVAPTTNTPVKVKLITSRVVANQGNTLTVSATVEGTTPSYQWYFGGSATGIKGATNSSYTVSNAQTRNAGLYTVVVTNPVSSVSSLANASVFTTNILSNCTVINSKIVSLAWDYDFISNPTVYQFDIYDGITSMTYTNVVIVDGQITFGSVSNLVPGNIYYFAVTAVDTNGLSSEYSSEVSCVQPPLSTITNINLNIYWLASLGCPAIQTKVCPYQSVTYQYKTNLVQPGWLILTNIIADQYGNSVYDDVGAKGSPQRYYRATTP